MISLTSFDLVPDDGPLSYLPDPWLSAYRSAITLGTQSLLLVTRELIRQSSLPPAERERRLDEFVDRARALANERLAREQEGAAAPESDGRIDNLLRTFVFAMASMQAVLDDYAMEGAPCAPAQH
jgi:hypothetical protein